MAKRQVVTSGTQPDTLVHLDPAVIMADPEQNARFSAAITPAEAEAMKASILEVGRVMEPIGVTVLDPPLNGWTHRARYGYRRLAGALLVKESGVADFTIPALILHEADQVGTLREQVAENVVRKTLSLMDIATAAKKMLDAGMSREQVREVFRRPQGTKGGGAVAASNAWLNMVLALLTLPAKIQERIHTGELGLAAAYRLMKAPPDKRLAILEAAEKETESIRVAEEKEEAKFAELDAKAKEAEAETEKAMTAIETAQAEVEIAEKAVETKQQLAADLYKKAQTTKDKEEKKKAEERRKAAEADARGEEQKLIAAKKALQKLEDEKARQAKKAEELRAKLAAAREAKPKAAAAPKAKGEGKISPKAIAKAAKAQGVETEGKVKLTGPQMRKTIEDLSAIESYEKVASIGKIIKDCFDSTITEGVMVKKLAALTGELRAKGK